MQIWLFELSFKNITSLALKLLQERITITSVISCESMKNVIIHIIMYSKTLFFIVVLSYYVTKLFRNILSELDKDSKLVYIINH